LAASDATDERAVTAALNHNLSCAIAAVNDSNAKGLCMAAAENLQAALRYLKAIEDGAVGPALAAFFDPSVTQTQFPNLLVPAGGTADLPAILAAAERGSHVVANQRYLVHNTLAHGEQVALEVSWSATLRVALGKTPAAGTISAEFAVFLRFRSGLIISQRNYDCFHAF
jgi:SnoaL-like domain